MLCKYPGCRKAFKDLKAHMLTHQDERPEKCPIETCRYHTKGFARRYDKNRHILMHYHGTMVCGFCPGTRSAAEKSCSRVDLFKRHWISVHAVEQTRPHGYKRSSGNSNMKPPRYAEDVTGRCSTCSGAFNNPQDFYEHLDACVISALVHKEPSEAINASRLAEIEEDEVVLDTLRKNAVASAATRANTTGDAYESKYLGPPDPLSNIQKRRGCNTPRSRGLTHCTVGAGPSARGLKKRKHYPSSWGYPVPQMKMKKRVLCVFEGPRRLCQDDMMLCTDYEVRIKIGDDNAYVTDLDIQTMRRADNLYTPMEKDTGLWTTRSLAKVELESSFGVSTGLVSDCLDANDDREDEIEGTDMNDMLCTTDRLRGRS